MTGTTASIATGTPISRKDHDGKFDCDFAKNCYKPKDRDDRFDKDFCKPKDRDDRFDKDFCKTNDRDDRFDRDRDSYSRKDHDGQIRLQLRQKLLQTQRP